MTTGEASEEQKVKAAELAAVVCAGFSRRADVGLAEIEAALRTLHPVLLELMSEKGALDLRPAVPVERSVADDHLICLEDGRRLKLLKRYLKTHYGLSPAEYRAKWNLPADYPMAAPSYARARSEMAKRIGLGKKPRQIEG